MQSFKVIEEGAFADYEFEAQAETIEELFAVCGQASFEAMTDTSKVESKKTFKFDVSAETLEDLLFAFLAELIYLKDVNKMFFTDFVIEIKNKYDLECVAKGEKIDSRKHELKTDVKAVTYHNLRIKEEDDYYKAHVILDL